LGWHDNLKSKYDGAIIYNIRKQTLDHDPDSLYIRIWIPELTSKNIKQLVSIPVDGYIPLVVSERQMQDNINTIKYLYNSFLYELR